MPPEDSALPKRTVPPANSAPAKLTARPANLAPVKSTSPPVTSPRGTFSQAKSLETG